MLGAKQEDNAVSDLRFDGPPENGTMVQITSGHSQPTPYHVEKWVNGSLTRTWPFSTRPEAERLLEDLKGRSYADRS